MPDLQRTALYEAHLDAGARMVPFAGWELPVRYRSIIEEHHAVRRHAGCFDVSHMGRFRVTGPEAAIWLDRAIAGNVGGLPVGHGLYSVMLHESGGIVDDLIVYRLAPDSFLMVVNAANRQKDWQHLVAQQHDAAAGLYDMSDELAMIAVAGPDALALLSRLTGGILATTRRFDVTEVSIEGTRCLAARTGYTGEDGAELMVPREHAVDVWALLRASGVVPCGLGARDTLRLEAAFCLYGNEIDDRTNPIEAGLGWTVHLAKQFTGREAVLAVKHGGPPRRLVGIRMEGRAIPRPGSPLLMDGHRTGVVTSGSHSPTLEVGIALGYVESAHAVPGTAVSVDIRGRRAPATVVRLPFYKRV